MKEAGAKIVVRALEAGEVAFSFGIPGTHNIELYDALIDSKKIQTVLVTDEQSASFMADGVARASGKLACVNVVPGAGLTHALSGIAEAYLDQIPMLVLGCGIRQDTGAAYQLHHVAQSEIIRPICKKVYQARTHAEAYQFIREACLVAQQAPAGPVFVEIPVNLYLFPGLVPEQHESNEAIRIRLTSRSELVTEPKKLSTLIQTLNASEKIVLYVGLGAQSASEHLNRLAERLDAIVFTTISAKGLFPEDHPRWAWNTIGRAAPKPIRQFFESCDCLLAIACRFGEVATGSYGLTTPEKFIHIDIDPVVFNQNFSAQLTLQAEAEEAIQALLAADLKQRNTNQERLDALRKAQDEIRTTQKSGADKTPAGLMAPYALLTALQEEFGPDTIYVTDSGNGTFLAMEQLRLGKPRSFLGPIDYSCMGYSVPAAIGAQLAAPERPVIALAGDGAFLMTGLELLTAAAYGAGVIVCILNDGKLSQIAQFQKASLGREAWTTLPSLNWEGIATALHIPYLQVGNQQELPAILAHAHRLSHTGQPVLVNVAIDYSGPSFFSRGVIKTNLLRFPWQDRMRLVGRFLKRKILPPATLT